MELKTIIEWLNKILREKDIDIICDKILNSDYRLANTGSEKEFDYFNIFYNCKTTKTICKDKQNEQRYCAELATKIESDKEIIFISITKFNLNKKHNVYLPCNSLLFTNAPINVEFEKDQTSLMACENCKNSFVKRNMLKYCGKWYCEDCFCYITEIEAKQYEKEHPEEFEFI